MATDELIYEYINAISNATYVHDYCDDFDENDETQHWQRVNKLRRKLQKRLLKLEKKVIKLLDNEPSPIYVQPDDWTDACQEREEWRWEYDEVCTEMYDIRVVLGLKRMTAREWYKIRLASRKNK